MKRCVIVGGADINNYEYIRKQLREDDHFIYCDSGLRHMPFLQREADLIVGDFDSFDNPHINVETIVLPCVKDDTDTVFAAKEAVKRGFNEFLLIGVAGARLDHTLGNVSILLYLDSIGKRGRIIDDYSEMEIVSGSPVSVSGRFSFFSILSITGCAEGVTVTGSKYPLSEATISCEYQYGISNEVIPGETAQVSVKNGKLLLIKVFNGQQEPRLNVASPV